MNEISTTAAGATTDTPVLPTTPLAVTTTEPLPKTEQQGATPGGDRPTMTRSEFDGADKRIARVIRNDREYQQAAEDLALVYRCRGYLYVGCKNFSEYAVNHHHLSADWAYKLTRWVAFIEAMENFRQCIKANPPREWHTRQCETLGISPQQAAEAEDLPRLIARMNKRYKTDSYQRKLTKLREADAAALATLNGKEPWTITDNESVMDATGAVIMTDPPQGIIDEEWDPKSVEELEATTLGWAVPWNDARAEAIVIFWSEKFLFEGRQWFDQALKDYDFCWPLLHWVYPNDIGHHAHHRFQTASDPILVYVRKDSNPKFGYSGSRSGGEFSGCNWMQCPTPTSAFSVDHPDFRRHPCQKPLIVCRWLIQGCSRIGQTIIDPFAGSASIGIATVQLGRVYHGIERSAEYRELARGRLAQHGRLDSEYQQLIKRIA